MTRLRRFAALLTFSLLASSLALPAHANDKNKITNIIKKFYKLPQTHFEISQKYVENTDADHVDNQVGIQFIEKLREVATGGFLEGWERFVGETSIYSSIYEEVFDGMTPLNGYSIRSVEIKNNKAIVKVGLKVSELYSLTSNLGSIDDLYENYNISNIKIEKARKILPPPPLEDLVEYRVTTEKIEVFNLVLIEDGWRIYEFNEEKGKSELEVLLPK